MTTSFPWLAATSTLRAAATVSPPASSATNTTCPSSIDTSACRGTTMASAIAPRVTDTSATMPGLIRPPGLGSVSSTGKVRASRSTTAPT